MATFKHKGYTLVQEEKENHHYSIFDPDGKFVLHASYVGKLFSKEEAEKHIEMFLAIRNIKIRME